MSLLRPGRPFCFSLPGKRQGSAVMGNILVSQTPRFFPAQRPLSHARLLLPDSSQALVVFIDSGSDASIMDEELMLQLGIDRVPLSRPVPASALDGHLLGTVTHQTVPVHMLLSGKHHETIQFHVLRSPHIPLILGYPWLRRHNPNIDWETGAILGWSPSCHQICLKQAAAPQRSVNLSQVPDVIGVPPEYLDFKEIFSKTRATSLPPHRPYDCAINLHPGTSPPRGRLYSLSAPERVSMETYINNSLAAGLFALPHHPLELGSSLWRRKTRP